MREFEALGARRRIAATTGIENVESCFFNRFGQLIYKEPRGKLAGYKYPEVGIHRGRLHLILYKAALARLGADSVVTDHECTGFEQDENGVTVHFKESATGRTLRAGARRRRDRLRRHQFGDPQAALSGRCRGVRRHQHLARRDEAQADPDRHELYARRLDPDRQDRDLSDHRQCRRRGQPAHQLDGGDQAARRSTKNDWNKPGNLADFHSIYAGLAVRLARCRRPDQSAISFSNIRWSTRIRSTRGHSGA